MALLLNGTSSAIDFGSKAEYLIIDDLTWCAWLRLNSSTGASDLIAHLELSTAETEAANILLFLRTQGSSDSWDIQYIHENGNGVNNSTTFATDLRNDTWYRIAVVRNISANTVDMYLNGDFHSTFNPPNPPTNTGASTRYIVGSRFGTSAFLNCQIDDVFLGNEAWTEGEVKEDAQGKSITRGRVHHAFLNPDEYVFAIDQSGYGNHAAVIDGLPYYDPPVIARDDAGIDPSIFTLLEEGAPPVGGEGAAMYHHMQNQGVYA